MMTDTVIHNATDITRFNAFQYDPSNQILTFAPVRRFTRKGAIFSIPEFRDRSFKYWLQSNLFKHHNYESILVWLIEQRGLFCGAYTEDEYKRSDIIWHFNDNFKDGVKCICTLKEMKGYTTT